MQNVIITELVNNLSFRAEIDSPPEIKQSFTTVYVEEKQVKRPTVALANGEISVKLNEPNDKISNFLKKWHASKKRINLMIETNEHMYLLKDCSVKKFENAEKEFLIYYNTFKEA